MILEQIQHLSAPMIDQLSRNQFMSGGLVLGFGAVIVNYLKSVPNFLYKKFLITFSYEVTIPGNTELFKHFQEYFSIVPLSRFTKNYKAFSKSQKDNEYDDTLTPRELRLGAKIDDKSKDRIKLSLGNGRHWFWNKGTLIICTRTQKDEKNNNPENFQLRIFTVRKKKVFKFLNESLDLVCPQDDSVKVYTSDGYGWQFTKAIRNRSSSNLILNDDIYEKVEKDILHFFSSEKWFHERGLQHKRGYLFYGPPGNGKTTTIICLASKLKVPIYIIPKLTDYDLSKLSSVIGELPPKSFLVFEDIDSMLIADDTKKDQNPDDEQIPKEKKEEKGKRPQNLSLLLNALDGITTPENYVLFLTTNYVDKLDPALIRPGRIDKKIEFDNPTEEQIKNIFLKFFPNKNKEANIFLKQYKNKNKSMAELQELLLEKTNYDNKN